MKKYVMLCLMLVVGATPVMAQSTVESLLKRYNNDDGVLAFNLNGDLTQFFNEADEGETIKSKVKNLSIVMFNKEDNISQSDSDKMISLLDSQGYDPLINARHEGQKIKVYALDGGSYINKLFAQVNTADYNIYLTLDGEIHYDELSKINVDQFAKTGDMMKK